MESKMNLKLGKRLERECSGPDSGRRGGFPVRGSLTSEASK
jgi:hypothetical protein